MVTAHLNQTVDGHDIVLKLTLTQQTDQTKAVAALDDMEQVLANNGGSYADLHNVAEWKKPEILAGLMKPEDVGSSGG